MVWKRQSAEYVAGELQKNVGVMRMHYTMVHGRGVAGAAPTERQDMQYAGGIMARGYESMPAIC